MNHDKQMFLVNGPIGSENVLDLITGHQSRTDSGALSFFLGQVRADEKAGLKITHEYNKVVYIEYSAYNKMAGKEMGNISQEAVLKFGLTCVHIYHSLGKVKAGEISLLVMASASHRENCFDSMKFIVNEIKKRVPIWKKEIFEDGSYRWVE